MYLFLLCCVMSGTVKDAFNNNWRVLGEVDPKKDPIDGNFYYYHNGQKYTAITEYFKNGFAT